MESLLAVNGISFSAGGTSILSGVSLTMARGEILSVIGSNGAGKSTLARCIAGLAAPSAGSIFFAGKNRDAASALSALSRRERARRVCYMPQSQGDLPPFTVRDFVAMGRYAHRSFPRSARRDAERVDDALSLAGAAHLAGRLLPTLSGGERQTAAIAAGLAQEAELLVLDEPATYLDPARQDALLELLLRINGERGVSLLLVTHDVNMAMHFTHRAVALRKGSVVFAGAGSELADEGILAKIYDAEFARLPLPGKDIPLAVSGKYTS